MRIIEIPSGSSAADAQDTQRVREAERERIARALHDTLLQASQALLFRLGTWEADPHMPMRLATEMNTVAAQTRELVREVREAIGNLRGPVEEGGCLLRCIEEASRVRGLGRTPPLEHCIQGTPRWIHFEACEHLTAIVIEALQNTTQHARASVTLLALDFRGAGLKLTITDDGCGFDPQILAASPALGHFGLLGMFERAQLLNAHLSIETQPGVGTHIQLIVPSAVYA